MRLIWIGTALELAGLLLALVSVLWFHRLTMTAFFAAGVPAVAAGAACYVAAVVRVLVRRGAL
jgi:hypothetical protein